MKTIESFIEEIRVSLQLAQSYYPLQIEEIAAIKEVFDDINSKDAYIHIERMYNQKWLLSEVIEELILSTDVWDEDDALFRKKLLHERVNKRLEALKEKR